MSSLQQSRPLDGIRVLDLTANVAGPLACQVLTDLGAQVIKVEPPGGEAARRITATARGAEHVTPYFSPNNRGKLSVELALGSTDGAAALTDMIRNADVIVQGMRPGAMARRGFGPDEVAAINPRCIYASLSAYGGGSELQDRPGIDMMVQAEAGCLSGQPKGRTPRLIPFQLVDSATGHVLAQAVLAALLHRERAGVVNRVDVSLYDVACSLQANFLTLQMNLPPKPAQAQEDSTKERRAVAVEPSGVYPTSDGDIVLAAYVPAHWSRLVGLIGSPELAADNRFVDQAARSVNAQALREVLTQALAARGADEWVELFDKAGLMAARINSWADVIDSDIFADRHLRVSAEQDGRRVDVLRTPARYSSFSTTTETRIPARAEHSSLLADRTDAARVRSTV
ncbi:CoA transferase [Gordonia sp. CPCC 205515]|uniref:CoA transferase n=1 Tax=Gordonia sp. CPCC 205515 TaxID=3140791 RepID=UPI003AF3F7DF